MLWYAVHSRPKQEHRALENLQNQGYEAWLPMITLEKLRRGRVTEVVEPMFSRYLFIRLDMEHTNWTPIRSTLGVSRLVSFGNRPAPMADELIQALRGLPERLQYETKVPVQLSPQPLEAVVLGAGHCIENYQALRGMFMDARR